MWTTVFAVTFYCRVQDRPVLLGVCRKSTDYSHHRIFRKISLFLQVLSTLGIFLGTITVQTALKPYSQPAHSTLETRACSLLCVGIVGKRLILPLFPSLRLCLQSCVSIKSHIVR